ncbi:GAF domain-containing protein [Candidatus Zixiibacteriota bacterium]
MTEQPLDYQAIKKDILNTLARAADAPAAMDLVVAKLSNKIPYYDWVGIYLVEGDILVLGPYRGAPSPHTKIPIGEGICGAAAAARETIIVPNVNADSRYLACSIKTKAEVVVPIMDGAVCLGEIDIDSHTPNAFTPQDRELLEDIATALARVLKQAQ